MSILSNFSISHIKVNVAIVSIDNQVFYFRKRCGGIAANDLPFLDDILSECEGVISYFSPDAITMVRAIDYDDKHSNLDIFIDVFSADRDIKSPIHEGLRNIYITQRQANLYSDSFSFNDHEYYLDFLKWGKS